MAIATSSGTGTPFAKFRDIGDTLVGAHASKPGDCIRQQRDYKTQEPKFKDDGTTPLKEEVLWLIAMPGTTAGTGDRENGLTPIEPGDLVRFAVSGYKWGQVIDARKELPAQSGFRLGETATGDVYTITLVGWSAETKNAAAAAKAGFNVVDGRIVLRTQDEKDAYILAQSKAGGNTNPAVDYEITIRRPGPADKAWEQRADETYLAKPWANQGSASNGVPADQVDTGDFEEPF